MDCFASLAMTERIDPFGKSLDAQENEKKPPNSARNFLSMRLQCAGAQ
jgi:hypothetical protein